MRRYDYPNVSWRLAVALLIVGLVFRVLGALAERFLR